ncbi:hypothetical protein PybrP1_000631 [[Pythium] brassicae (nom. inval.)]|nr:hypothetical protein PybrP1_000631 [[Pythium] brassicae (nom. inval.)]
MAVQLGRVGTEATATSTAELAPYKADVTAVRGHAGVDAIKRGFGAADPIAEQVAKAHRIASASRSPETEAQRALTTQLCAEHLDDALRPMMPEGQDVFVAFMREHPVLDEPPCFLKATMPRAVRVTLLVHCEREIEGRLVAKVPAAVKRVTYYVDKRLPLASIASRANAMTWDGARFRLHGHGLVFSRTLTTPGTVFTHEHLLRCSNLRVRAAPTITAEHVQRDFSEGLKVQVVDLARGSNGLVGD